MTSKEIEKTVQVMNLRLGGIVIEIAQQKEAPAKKSPTQSSTFVVTGSMELINCETKRAAKANSISKEKR